MLHLKVDYLLCLQVINLTSLIDRFKIEQRFTSCKRSPFNFDRIKTVKMFVGGNRIKQNIERTNNLTDEE